MRITCVLRGTKWGIAYLERINLKKFFFTLTVFFVGFCGSLAQDMPNELWNPGYLILDEGDTLRGTVQYDFKSNLVQVKVDNRIQTFSSQQVLMLGFHCQFFKRFRMFYSIPYNIRGSMTAPIFFEILEEGQLTLMAREYVVTESGNRFGSGTYRSSPFGSREILTYDYYLLTYNGDIEKYEERKKYLLPYFGKYREVVNDFIKENDLDVDRQADLVKIINFYNSLYLENQN